jgi:hypothetical protein
MKATLASIMSIRKASPARVALELRQGSFQLRYFVSQCEHFHGIVFVVKVRNKRW